jgi:TRAP-type C4-dicarboxylate transport system substrate-binding protein
VSEGALSFYVGILPTRVYEVARFITECDVGAMYVGGIAANRQRFERWPENVRRAMTAAGKASTEAHIRDVSDRIATAKREMVARGAVVSTLPEAERQRWIRGLPNLARTWAESSGPASREVLNAYFAAIRAAGQTPGRNWDRELTA